MTRISWLTLFLIIISAQTFSAPFIDWGSLANPIIHPDIVTKLTGRETNSLKDAALYYNEPDRTFYIFFSDFFDASNLVGIKTKDFKTFSLVLDRKDGCSPDLVKYHDTYYITYQTGYGYDPPDYPGKTIWYTTSTNLQAWSAPKALCSNVTLGQRSIDAATALSNGTFYCAWKLGRDPYVAKSTSLTGNTWTGLGYVKGEWAENYQFISIDNKWYVIATAEMGDETHAPVIITLQGDPQQDTFWTNWQLRRKLDIPYESWNPKAPHNAVYLADWRKYDGYFYVIYCGQDNCCVGNNGFRLGMARSTDLKTWYKPGDTRGNPQVTINSHISKTHLTVNSSPLKKFFSLNGKTVMGQAPTLVTIKVQGNCPVGLFYHTNFTKK